MNDIKNENERLTLPFVPEAVIVGNGDFPSHPFPLAVFDQAPCVVCCDGAANALADSGRVPDLIVGDGDSLSEENRIRFHDRIHRIPDQETNDQTKAVMFLLSQGIKRIVLIGATGKREDHTLGNISLLMEYQQMGAEVVMLTDYGFFIPATGDKVFAGFPRQQVSVFNFGAIQLRSEGLKYPIYLSKTFWLGVVFVYIFIASITPVWILLQPRDYLNSFLLYFMIIAAVVGILGTNPAINLPAFTGWTNSFNGQVMFPYLFITVACGAISGFHSLIASGTTSKQLNNEGDAKLIGYGSMLIECVLAVIALIAVGALFSNGKMPQGTPAVVFASAISGFFSKLGMGQVAVNTTFTVISLAISAFALTSLDTATRLGRFLFQELFTSNKAKENSKVQGYLGNMYVGTFITVGLGAVLCLGGYQNICALFLRCICMAS